MTTCDKCGKQIMMLNHKKSGSLAPIEAEPNENGNILVKGSQYRIATNVERAKAKEIKHPLYLNHFASCVYAEDFRKK